MLAHGQIYATVLARTVVVHVVQDDSARHDLIGH
jgi:hypothetical protein